MLSIVYFVVGSSLVNHEQVGFSLRTFLPQLAEDDRIFVVTDIIPPYMNIPKLTIVPISQETIKEWRGKHDFFWRVKIMVMKEISMLNPNSSMIYLDGDTYLKGELNTIKGLLNDGIGLMHKDEGCPGDIKGRSSLMWNTIENRSYAGITINRDLHMWNAGVVAIPNSILNKTIDLAIAICDGMLDDNAEPVVIEQYSLSIALNNYAKHMVEADRWIEHYWQYKYWWSRFISKFFIQSYLLHLSLGQEVNKMSPSWLRTTRRKVVLLSYFAKIKLAVYKALHRVKE